MGLEISAEHVKCDLQIIQLKMEIRVARVLFKSVIKDRYTPEYLKELAQEWIDQQKAMEN